MKILRNLLFMVAVFLFVSFPLNRQATAFRANAQQAAGTAGGDRAVQPATPQPDPPGTIDGGKNPELIPDEAAYRLVLLAVAERENATEEEMARFQAKIAPAGLDDNDAEAFLGILTAFQKQLDALQGQASAVMARDPFPQPGSVDYNTLLQLGQQKQAVFAEAMGAVPARLSSDGAAKLDAYVKGEKRSMKYIPDMPTP
jgi:hypothetical protein